VKLPFFMCFALCMASHSHAQVIEHNKTPGIFMAKNAPEFTPFGVPVLKRRYTTSNAWSIAKNAGWTAAALYLANSLSHAITSITPLRSRPKRVSRSFTRSLPRPVNPVVEKKPLNPRPRTDNQGWTPCFTHSGSQPIRMRKPSAARLRRELDERAQAHLALIAPQIVQHLHTSQVRESRQTQVFTDWYMLQDTHTRGQIDTAIDNVRHRHQRNIHTLREGPLQEYTFRNGMRLYFTIEGNSVVWRMGGNKNSQDSDIAIANGTIVNP
jgi:putative addiction module killer protein